MQEDQATETQETKKQGYKMQEYKSWKTQTKAKNSQGATEKCSPTLGE